LFARGSRTEKNKKRTKKTRIAKTPCSVQKGQKENATNNGISFRPFAPALLVLRGMSVFFFSLFFFCFSVGGGAGGVVFFIKGNTIWAFYFFICVLAGFS